VQDHQKFPWRPPTDEVPLKVQEDAKKRLTIDMLSKNGSLLFIITQQGALQFTD
jgi:hypothetical protein